MDSTTAGDLAPSSSALRTEAMQGMACLDTSVSPRIPILMEMVGALSRARSPHQVIRDFGRGIAHIQHIDGYISLSTRGLKSGEYRVTRLINGAVTDAEVTDTWTRPAQQPVFANGFLSAIVRQAYPEIIQRLDVRNDPALGAALEPFGSMMAIPLFDNGEPLNWAIMLRKDPDGFTIQELEESILRSNLVGTTVRNVLNAQQLRKVNEQNRREMERIADIQRALLPQTLPAIPGVSLGASYATFDQAGGDYYDLIELEPAREGGPSRWAILIADAAGHGPAAAVVMAMVNAIVGTYSKNPDGPAEVLHHVNEHLHAKRVEHSFVTAALGIYDPADMTFTHARAGHNPIIHMHRNDAGGDWIMDRLDGVGGVPLGIMDDAEYDEATLQLAPGQTLVFYTDGITEAMSPSRRMFGVIGIEQCLSDCSGEPDCVIGHVNGALRTHEADERPTDDQTLLVMRIEDPATG